VNYHLEHHLFMFVPCWRLPQAHKALLAAGFGGRLELKTGYRAVLAAATSAAADKGKSSGPGAGVRGMPQHI
jgi:fatty acid desaturase